MNVNDIKAGQKITVNGKEYSAIAKVFFISVNTGRKFCKVFLTDNCIIGYNLPQETEIAYFGELIETLPYDYYDLPDEIIYNGKTYKKDGGEQYQRVLKLELGDLNNSEGECRFINYSADDDSWLSPGLITQTGARADFYGEDMSKYEISFD